MNPNAPSQQSRTITWSDNSESLAQLPQLSGLDYLTKIRDGELPAAPISAHFDLGVAALEHGTITFTCQPNESHYNPIGMVHGGLVSTLLDSALGCAVHTTLPAGTGYTSIDLKVYYLRPVTSESGPLSCTGRVVKEGRRVAFSEGEVVDRDGKVVATGTSSLLIFPL